MLSSYSSISLLDSIGKILQRMISDSPLSSSLRISLSRVGKILMVGKYCAVMTLDVKNASNLATGIELKILWLNWVSGFLHGLVNIYLLEKLCWSETDDGSVDCDSRCSSRFRIRTPTVKRQV